MSTTHAPLEESLGDFERAWTDATLGGGTSGSVSADVTAMTEPAVMGVSAPLRALQRQTNLYMIAVAGFIADHSRPSLGTDGMARKAGHAKPAQLVAQLFGITVGEAIRLCDVGLATRSRTALDGTPLPARYPVVAAAIADGTLGVDSAAVIVKELDAASVRCSVDAREAGEVTLVEMAAQYSVADLHGLARQVRDRLDEDGAEPRDEVHHRQRSVRFIALSGGMVRMVWDMPPEVAGLVKASVEAIVGQDLRRAKNARTKIGGTADGAADDCGAGDGTGDGADHSSADDGAANGDSADGGCDGSLLGDDDRTLDQLRSDAAEQVFHHVASCRGHGGDIPSITMVIRMSVDALTTGLGIAEIDGIDETISAGTARRMAGEAGIIPAVLGGPSEVLDFGKTRRLFSTAQKLAFGERDGGCAFGGCQAPPSYTEAHHIIWWSDVENTDLDNGILLCGFHHHRIHDGGWDIAFQHGVPYFIPPPWVDPGRAPRRGGKVTLGAAA
jgi:hypothetical protein